MSALNRLERGTRGWTTVMGRASCLLQSLLCLCCGIGKNGNSQSSSISWLSRLALEHRAQKGSGLGWAGHGAWQLPPQLLFLFHPHPFCLPSAKAHLCAHPGSYDFSLPQQSVPDSGPRPPAAPAPFPPGPPMMPPPFVSFMCFPGLGFSSLHPQPPPSHCCVPGRTCYTAFAAFGRWVVLSPGVGTIK